MKLDEIRRMQSRPARSVGAARGPYHFVDREYLLITYESEPQAIRAALPEPLQPAGTNKVHFQFIRVPESEFGHYTASAVVIPAKLRGEFVNFIAQMYLDDKPPMAGGHEIWGFPRDCGLPKLEVVEKTLTGTLDCAGVQVAIGTMDYRSTRLIYDASQERICDPAVVPQWLARTRVNLKFLPNVDGLPAAIQLIGYNLSDIRIKGAWSGPAQLSLATHKEAPVADLPIRQMLGGLHFVADLVVPDGRVLHDYLAEVDAGMPRGMPPACAMACP